ncbi:tail protein X [Pseudoalteromonas luteoviolacea]|nr:tail protein X [Pseudoalteromonas luteoviolacea]
MQKIYTVQGETVDSVCHKHYGNTAGITEQVIEANPHITFLPPVLPTNTLLMLPTTTKPTATKKLIQLWD